MAGHTSEKRWRNNQNQTFQNIGVSDQASAIVKGVLAALTVSEAAYAEMQEMYAFAGGTVQDLADQLFKEDWEVRGAPGVNATLTVDAVAGVVDSVAITNAGTGYTDGTGFTMNLVLTAGGGDGAAVISYDVVSGSVTNAAVDTPGDSYVDGTGQVVQETPAAGVILETEANAEELAKTQDLFDAITAVHELHQCADNQTVVAEDRYAQLRRMS
jgi:hypothetical protein